jgi:glycosyltransferase involved in cell wall biosynthesis
VELVQVHKLKPTFGSPNYSIRALIDRILACQTPTVRYNRISFEDLVSDKLENLCVLIPAYVPEASLPQTVAALLERPFRAVVVVNDGSPASCEALFGQLRTMPRVHVLAHTENLGKGASLKTGLGYVESAFPGCAGVVTADADGQHSPRDIIRVAEQLAANPQALVLGARRFDSDTPLRNRLGNQLSRLAVGLVVGQWLKDTQTGLRGIPRRLFVRLRAIPASGYEFELDVLTAAKHAGCEFVETPIETIYLSGNRSSHFNPLLDSMRVYFVLLRFGLVSVQTALLDNLVFLGVFSVGGGLLLSQAGGRLAGMLYQYSAARRAVFLSNESHRKTLPRYVILATASGVASYLLIRWLWGVAGMAVLPAKLLAETALFFVNFAVSRDFVFTRRKIRTDDALQ